MRKSGVLAEDLIKVSKRFRRLFLEQAIEDLGEVPVEPIGDDVDIDMEELGKEAYSEEVQELISSLEDAGVEGVEFESPTVFVIGNGGKRTTFEIGSIEGEPVVVIYTENGRVTVSLAPVLGYVTAPEDVINKLVSDGNAVKEFVGLVCDALGIEDEGESWTVEDGEEVEEEGIEEEEFEGAEEDMEYEEAGDEDVEEEEEDMEYEDLGDEGVEEEDVEEEEDIEEEEDEEVSESRLRRRGRGLRFREQTTGYDMASGRRDITIGLIQDSDEKIGSIPVKTIDIVRGVERKDVSGTEGMTFPNLYAFFQPREGMPDVEGLVSQGIKQGEEEREEGN